MNSFRAEDIPLMTLHRSIVAIVAVLLLLAPFCAAAEPGLTATTITFGQAAALSGPVAMLGTVVGVRLARFVPGTTQLVLFAGVMLAAAVFMLRSRPACDGDVSEVTGEPFTSVLKVMPGGLLVGLLTGVVGVGGGFLIVPALVLLRMSLREAVGTSLLIITGTCVVGFLGYLGHVSLDWFAVALVAAGTLPGIAIGSYLHHFVPQGILRRGFAAFLVVIAAFILIENLGPLSAVSHGR